MNDKTLQRVAIFSSLIGLILLFFAAQFLEITETQISAISPDSKGETVKICGQAASFFMSKDGHVFFSLISEKNKTLGSPRGNEKIKIVFFSATAEKNNITAHVREGDKTCVVGKVDIYRDELEVVGEKIVF